MKAVILLSVIAVAFATECGENEHYENCGVDCFVTCENYQKPPRACILRCDLGCQCDKGYVRSADGRCVRPEQCPGSSPKQCGENQHYESCGTACPLTCKNYANPPKACVLMCNPGCHCDKGFVKTDDGECVRPEQCPAHDVPVCGENQRYLECGTACPLTCDNYDNPPRICPLMCVAGCHCEPGFVKTNDGRCVRVENCPNKASAELCSLPAKVGLCRGYFPRFFFNQETGKCEKFIYGGCGGNSNNFKTEEECHNTCGSS